jgi:hypothetical protein
MAKLAVVDLAATFSESSQSARDVDERRAFERCQRIAMDQRNFDETYEGLHEAAMAELEGLRGFAKYLVNANAEVIDRVAEALAKHPVLDQNAIDKLLPPDER